jgi:hypothetical protein
MHKCSTGSRSVSPGAGQAAVGHKPPGIAQAAVEQIHPGEAQAAEVSQDSRGEGQ